MSDWEYYCPRCEEKIGVWDFVAPPDYYRCYVCALATPFKDLPRRHLLSTWTPATRPDVEVIARGSLAENEASVTTLTEVSSSPGSTLVIVVCATSNVSQAVVSATWNGLTETIPDEQISRISGFDLDLVVLSFKNVSGGTSPVVVTFNATSASSVIHAIEITNRTTLDKHKSAGAGNTTPSSGTSAALDETVEVAIGALHMLNDPDAGNSSWLNGYNSLQRATAPIFAGQTTSLYTSYNIVPDKSAQAAAYHTMPIAVTWNMALATYKK